MKLVDALVQCFSTFVRPRPGKSSFISAECRHEILEIFLPIYIEYSPTNFLANLMFT